MTEEINQTNEESLYRVNIKQSAKGESYFDVTVRGNTKDEVQARLNEVISIASATTQRLNSGVKQ